MKRLFGTLAAAALLVAPLSVSAQGRGMGHGFGGARGFAVGGHFHGGGFRGGGFRGRGFCCGAFPFFGGFALGAAFASPWYYWGDPWYWGPAPYDYYYGYDDYGPPPPPNGAAPPPACGRWIWRPDEGRYEWAAGACAAPAPQAAPAPYVAPAPYAPAPAPRG